MVQASQSVDVQAIFHADSGVIMWLALGIDGVSARHGSISRTLDLMMEALLTAFNALDWSSPQRIHRGDGVLVVGIQKQLPNFFQLSRLLTSVQMALDRRSDETKMVKMQAVAHCATLETGNLEPTYSQSLLEALHLLERMTHGNGTLLVTDTCTQVCGFAWDLMKYGKRDYKVLQLHEGRTRLLRFTSF